jgi:hypothetical protein
MSVQKESARGGALFGRGFVRGCAVAIGAMALIAVAAYGGINGGGRSRGAITARGSIFVNGVEYELAGSTITINGQPATEGQLRVGQVVTVDGFVNPDLTTGQAQTVAFESNVRGRVTAVTPSTASLTVLGQKVRVDGATKFDAKFVPANLAGITVGAIIEVSGFRDSSGRLVATRIQSTAASADRVVGKVSALDETALTFRIADLTVDYSTASLIEGTLADGELVEVRGPRVSGGTTLVANRIEVETEELEGETGEGGSLEGVVTAGVVNNVFSLNGQAVVITSSTTFRDGVKADVVVDARVEAEGRFDAGGRIVAEKVTIKHPDDAYVWASVDSIDLTNRTIRVVGLTVKINSLTRFEDKSDLRLKPFALKDLHTGDTVEITGYEQRKALNITAERLTRQQDDNRTRIGGRVSSVGTDQFVVLDRKVVTTPQTIYRNKLDVVITAARFYANAANREVKVRGDWNGVNLVARAVEFED